MWKWDGAMKQAVVILIGALLVAGALVFHAYQHRYEVAAVTGGPFVRLDSRTGQLSACVQLNRGTGDSMAGEAILEPRLKRLGAAGFTQKEITDWVTARAGQMVCSPWNE
jgi:hypothetical protein